MIVTILWTYSNLRKFMSPRLAGSVPEEWALLKQTRTNFDGGTVICVKKTDGGIHRDCKKCAEPFEMQRSRIPQFACSFPGTILAVMG